MKNEKPITTFDLIGFIESKFVAASTALQRREEMQMVWKSGTDESWQKVGCQKSKKERLKESEMHARIAIKNRK